MSAKHALLGLLMDRPAYRYALGDRLRERLGPAWDINSGQLYQTVDQLERKGLVERKGDSGEGGADRLQFAITNSGVDEFERWFNEDSGEARLLRRALLVKITLAGPTRLGHVLGQIDAYERDCTARLKDLSRVHEAIVPDLAHKVRADHILLRLNLAADIRQLEGELQWARDAREIIGWLLDQDVIWPSSRNRAGVLSKEEPRAARKKLFGRMASEHLQAASTDSGQATGTGGPHDSSLEKPTKSRGRSGR